MKFVLVCVFLSIFVISVKCNPVARESGMISPDIICRQAFVLGTCPDDSFSWSYDPSKGKCLKGCGNNENKFSSKKDCENMCKGVHDTNGSNFSEEIKIRAFERVNDPNAKEPDF